MDVECHGGPHRQPQLEFLLCGSPTDAFYSQIAFFRLSLDRLGEQGLAARVVAVFGAEKYSPLPSRWAPHFERVEVHHAAPEEFRRRQLFAASDLRFGLLTAGSSCSCLCDADTALVRPLPRKFLEELQQQPAICGVPAHYPFPIEADTCRTDARHGLYPGMPQGLAWDRLGGAILGRRPSRQLRYTLLEGESDNRCPFYINYGFLAGPPDLLRRLYAVLTEVQPALEELLSGYFVGQVGIALAVEKTAIPWRALPMRFNFPNDRTADRLYPQELDQVILIHYLRHSAFDRHRIFAERAAFEEFLSLDLAGSDRTFRDHVLKVTGGVYPFGAESLPSSPTRR
jgi:hypothetical protein